MFSNLSKGNILYVLDKRDKLKWSAVPVEQVNPVYAKSTNASYGQLPEIRLDIMVNLNGEQRTFQQVPSNTVIADFGERTFVISDNKDSLYNYMKNLLQSEEKIVRDVPYHEALIPQCKEILNDLVPGSAPNDEVKELREELASIKEQFKEVITLLKGDNTKAKE